MTGNDGTRRGRVDRIWALATITAYVTVPATVAYWLYGHWVEVFYGGATYLALLAVCMYAVGSALTLALQRAKWPSVERKQRGPHVD